MQAYLITGYHRPSGKQRTAKVKAGDERAAMTVAEAHGFSDVSIVPIDTGNIVLLADSATRGASQSTRAKPPTPRSQVVHRHVQTIQATGKIWKLLTMLSMVAMIIGIVYLIQNGAEGAKAGLAMLGTAAGLFMAIFARIGGWWCHG